MNQHSLIKFRRFARAGSALALGLGCASLLASCAVSSPLSVQSERAAFDTQDNRIALSLPQDGDPAMNTRFATALLAALSSRNITISADGGLVADYGVSMGAAQMGVQILQTGQNEPIWIAPPRRSKRFDECDGKELRGSLLLLNRETGAIVYNGTGSMTDCDFGDDALRAVADGLVADYAARR